VCDWRSSISEKFSKLPGIRSLHDYVYAKSASGLVAAMRNLCYTGLYELSISNVLRGRFASECVIPVPLTQSYSALGEKKTAN